MKRIQVKGLTIDADHSKDLDDAFWVEQTKDGYTVDISISDVANAVKLKSKTDEEMLHGVETLYFSSFNKPLLHPRLSEGSLSLLPKVARKTVTIRLLLNHDFQIVDKQFFKSILKSEAKISHDVCDKALLDTTHEHSAQIRLCQTISAKFYSARRARGACAMYDVISHLYADEDGIVRKYDEDFFHAQMIVQEMMIAANEQIASYFATKGVPALYRNHKARAIIPNRDEFMRQVNEALINPDLLGILREKMNMWLEKATYGTALEGHYGLNVPAYVHITSPIRRYADLVNLRILKALMRNCESPYTKEQLDELATKINKWHSEYDAKRQEHFKKRNVKKKESKLNNEIFLKTLDQTRFSQHLKAAIKANILSAELAEAINERLKKKTLHAFDYYYLLFRGGEPFHIFRQQLLDSMLGQEFIAVSILELRKSKDNVDYKFNSLTNQIGFIAWTICDGLVGTPASSNAKKTAQGQAAHNWLCSFFANTLSKESEYKFDAPTNETVPTEKADKNYVGIVNEWCQQRKLNYPILNFKNTGPDHSPQFFCVAELPLSEDKKLKGEGVALSKKDAKQLAHKSLFTQLEQ